MLEIQDLRYIVKDIDVSKDIYNQLFHFQIPYLSHTSISVISFFGYKNKPRHRPDNGDPFVSSPHMRDNWLNF